MITVSSIRVGRDAYYGVLRDWRFELGLIHVDGHVFIVLPWGDIVDIGGRDQIYGLITYYYRFLDASGGHQCHTGNFQSRN